MIVIAAFILGAAIGWMRAAKAGGSRADKLQYAVAHALALTVLGIFLTVFVSRMG
jgi:flagellar motor component MotA